ncbi:hypothetical protein ACJ51O_31645 [Burkholderia pyrrocinia]|uniref:hypothetical protein n=1 Tax=Burkholderia pyrrocinia TaxID=60550 RepID=UPI0038B60C33
MAMLRPSFDLSWLGHRRCATRAAAPAVRGPLRVRFAVLDVGAETGLRARWYAPVVRNREEADREGCAADSRGRSRPVDAGSMKRQAACLSLIARS